jgi:hypothetical protein
LPAARVPVAVTFGIALATLVVAGGILAVPTVLSCAGDPDGLARCLRERIDDLGLGGAPRPGVVAEIPIETGRLDVMAAVPPPIPPSGALLAVAPGQAEAVALEPPSAAGGRVELAAERGDIVATSPPDLPPRPAATTLAPAPVVLAVAVSAPEVETPPAAALAPTAGGLEAGAAAAEAAPAAADLQPLPVPAPPSAEEAPPAPEPPPAEEPAPAPPFETPLIEAEIAPPPPNRPAPMIRNDPAYPNVIVLPPPATGAGSSFATLELN